MAGINRYKLVYRYFDGREKVFDVNYEDGTHRDRFMLTEIDALTSKFSNDDELSKVLNLVSDGYKDGYFIIEYNSNGKAKTMELVYNNIPSLGSLALKNLRKTKISSDDAETYMKDFIKLVNEDGEFLKFILSHRYTNDYFKSALSYYLRLKNSDEREAQNTLWEAKANLKKEFTRYKTVRGIEIGKRNYKLFKEKKEIPRLRGELTVLQRAKLEHELNYPEKLKKVKPKKRSVIEGQVALFDADPYTDHTSKKKS